MIFNPSILDSPLLFLRVIFIYRNKLIQVSVRFSTSKEMSEAAKIQPQDDTYIKLQNGPVKLSNQHQEQAFSQNIYQYCKQRYPIQGYNDFQINLDFSRNVNEATSTRKKLTKKGQTKYVTQIINLFRNQKQQNNRRRRGKALRSFLKSPQVKQELHKTEIRTLTRFQAFLTTPQRPELPQKPQKQGLFALLQFNLKLAIVENDFGRDFKRYYPQQLKRLFDFLDSDQQLLWKQKNVVAEAFATLDNQYVPILKYISDSGISIELSDSRQKSTEEAVIIAGYRQVEKFIFGDCGIPIVPVPRQEIKKIRVALFNCRVTFPQGQALTFISFIRILYCIRDACLVKSQVLALYCSIIRLLIHKINQDPDSIVAEEPRKQRGTSKNYFKAHDSEVLKEVWCKDYDIELIQAFRQYDALQLIRQHFKSKFPNNREYFTIAGLRSRLQRIIRVSLRKLKRLVQMKYSQHIQIAEFSDKLVKRLLGYTKVPQLKRKLVQLYNGQPNYYRILEIVIEFNKFIENDGCPNYASQMKKQKLILQSQKIKKLITNLSLDKKQNLQLVHQNVFLKNQQEHQMDRKIQQSALSFDFDDLEQFYS